VPQLAQTEAPDQPKPDLSTLLTPPPPTVVPTEAPRPSIAEIPSPDPLTRQSAEPESRPSTEPLQPLASARAPDPAPRPAPPPEPEPVRRPARVAQMLALAHHLQAAIDQGHCRDRADLARTLDLTRARITQLLDLILLAPDIQEELLFLEAVDGAEPLSPRALRPIARRATWRAPHPGRRRRRPPR